MLRFRGLLPRSKEYGMRAATNVFQRPWVYRTAGKLARTVVPWLPRFMVYNRLNPWGKQRELPEFPRRSFRELDPGRLTVLQEVVAPLARLWLPAHWEGSALAETLPFGTDPGSVETFGEDLRALADAERERLAVIERTPDALAIDEPEPYRAWAREHGPTVTGLQLEQRERLARWLTLFEGVDRREKGCSPVQREIAELERLLLSLPPDEVDKDAVEVARALPDDELETWTALSDRLTRKPSLLQTLSPVRWLELWKRRSLLKREGLTDGQILGAALHREIDLRPIRKRAVAVTTQIGEPTGHLGAMRASDLLRDLRTNASRLDEAEGLVARLETYPERPTAFAMARAATAQAVEDLMEGIDQGLARHAARDASRVVLSRLASWMDQEWTMAREASIEANNSNAAAIEPIVAQFPNVVAFQRFRARVPQVGDGGMEVIGELARIRGMLEKLPEHELETVVRRILATEARLAWKTRLENADPTLLLEAGELEAKAKALANSDQTMRNLNRRLLVDGLDASRLRPMREWEDITRLRGVRARRLREFVERGAGSGVDAAQAGMAGQSRRRQSPPAASEGPLRYRHLRRGIADARRIRVADAIPQREDGRQRR